MRPFTKNAKREVYQTLKGSLEEARPLTLTEREQLVAAAERLVVMTDKKFFTALVNWNVFMVVSTVVIGYLGIVLDFFPGQILAGFVLSMTIKSLLELVFFYRKMPIMWCVVNHMRVFCDLSDEAGKRSDAARRMLKIINLLEL